MIPPARPAQPSGWERLRGRLRHGLLVEAALGALAARRLVFLPYAVVAESFEASPSLPAPAGASFRELTPADAPALVAIRVRSKDVELLRQDFGAMRCFGVFVEASLVAYTWTRTTTVPLLLGGGTLFDLALDEAYLLDMYVDPRHRGLRVAPWLRLEVLRALAAEGRVHCFSLSSFFNRSSRSFKARLGAQEREWRLALQIGVGGLPGLDLRLWRRGAALRTALLRKRSRAWKASNGR